MTRRAHYRTEQIGLRLTHHIAPAVTIALDHIDRQRQTADGWPAHGDGVNRGHPDTSTTEAAAIEAIDHLDTEREKIIDVIEGIELAVSHLAKLVIGIDRTPAAGQERRCSDGQVGKDAILWSTNSQCPELPISTKMGLCGAHARAWLRYRTAHHLPIEQYFEDAR